MTADNQYFRVMLMLFLQQYFQCILFLRSEKYRSQEQVLIVLVKDMEFSVKHINKEHCI